MFEQLMSVASASAQDCVLTVNGKRYSRTILASAIERTAGWLQQRGVAPRDVAIIQTRDAGLYWNLFFALERLGAVSLGLPAQVAADRRLAGSLGARWVCSDSGADAFGEGAIALDDSTLRAMRAAHPAAPGGAPTAGDPVCIVLSSGTTGEPKPVLLTRGMLDLRVDRAIEAGFTMPRTQMACYMPTYTIGGLLAALQAWKVGGSISFPSIEPVEEVLADGASDTVVVVPMHCHAILERLPPQFVRTEPLTIFCGGAKLPGTLRAAIVERLGASIVEGYGTTETGIVTKLGADAEGGTLESSGRVLPWFEVEVIDGENRAIGPGEAGIVRIRGDEVITGYVGPDGNEIAVTSNGWYYPGDIGTIDEAGFLTILGRVDDVMNLGGRKALPQNIEALVRDLPGVLDVTAFAVPDPGADGDRLWLALVEDGEVELSALVERLAAFPAYTVVRLPALERNAMGKVPRQELRARALAGEFAGAEVRMHRGRPEPSPVMPPPSGPILHS